MPVKKKPCCSECAKKAEARRKAEAAKARKGKR